MSRAKPQKTFNFHHLQIESKMSKSCPKQYKMIANKAVRPLCQIPGQHSKISGSIDCFNLLWDVWDHETLPIVEEFWAIYTNAASKIIGCTKIATGGAGSVAVDIRSIFSVGILLGASAFVVAHNHPSESMKPSQADITLTKRLKEGGAIMGITLMDHLILTQTHLQYYSFADNGIL